MASPIINKISEWNITLTQYERSPDSPSLTDRVRSLYENCRQEETANRDLLKSDVSLQQKFNEIQSKVYSLFLRSIRKEMQADRVSPIGELNSEAWNLAYLAKKLYEGDDSQTTELVLELSENIRNILFKNLLRVLGKTASPIRIGEYAFLNTNGCSATTNDKYTAIVSSVSDGLQAWIFAASGNIEALRFLFSEGRQLSEEGLDKAAIFAVRDGHLEALRFLLSEGRQLSEKGLNEAASLAAHYGHIEALRSLLPEGRHLSETGLNEAARFAALNGNIEALRFLLSTGQLSQPGLDEAASSAARNDHTEALRFLLPEGKQLSQPGLDLAAKLATNKGQIETLRFLLSTGQLSQPGLDAAARSAASNGHIEALRFLLSEGRQISGERRDELVLNASSRGQFAIVEFLLMTGPIGASCRDSSITQARGERRDNIRDILRMAQIRPEDASVQRGSSSVQRGSNRSERMLISLEFIKQDPKAFLESLAAALPPSFKLEESPQTIDLGGVSKQVYATLFASLLEKEYLSPDAQGLACIGQDSSLPIYHTLGAFYSRFFEINKDRTDPFFTGHVFSSAFFALVKIMVEDPSDDASLLEQLESIKEDQRPFFALLQDKANRALKDQVIQMMAEIYSQEGDAVEFAEGIFRSYKNPILALMQGAKDNGVSDAFFSKLRAHAPEKFTEALQGKAISKDLVLKSLEISNEGGDPFREKVEWLKNKILTSDEAWLRKFVIALTGRDVLAVHTKLQLRPTWRAGTVFELHTCFNSLDLPHSEMNQEDFLAGLDGALNNPNFNIA